LTQLPEFREPEEKPIFPTSSASVTKFKAYSVSNHRHTSEIEQELSLLAEEEITVSFTPHLVPMKRGMLATIYANLNCENQHRN